MIKLRRMIWARHVAHMGEWKGVYKVLWESLRERDHVGDPGSSGSGMWGHGLDRAGSG